MRFAEFPCNDGQASLVGSLRLRVKVRRHQRNDRTEFIAPGDHRDYADAGILVADVDIKRRNIKTLNDVRNQFLSVSESLTTTDKMTPGMLNELLHSLDHPPATINIVNFGRQPDGSMVFANTVLDGGKLGHVETLGIDNEYFSTRDLKLLPAHFPRIVLCREPWVPAILWDSIVNVYLAEIFLNNRVQALCTLAWATLQLQASQIWVQRYGRTGNPSLILYSPGKNTGKTTAMQLVHALTGQNERPIPLGANASTAYVNDSLTLYADVPQCYDELLSKGEGDQNESKKWKDVVHSVYDQTPRSNLRHNAKPVSGLCATTNWLPNKTDDKFHDRVLVVHFDPLDASDATSSNLFPLLERCMSFMLPFLESIALHAGGIADCQAFMNEVADTKFNRNANLWGLLLYMTILLCFAGNKHEVDDVFEYITNTSMRAHREQEKNGSPIRQFMLHLHKVHSSANADPIGIMQRSVHWHNLRTTARRSNSPHDTMADPLVAVRLDSVLLVIKNVLNVTLDADLIKQSAIDTGEAYLHKAKIFYDTRSHEWPIYTTLVDDATGLSTRIPLPEEQLTAASLSDYGKPALWFKAAHYEAVILDQYNNTDHLDYKTVLITREDGSEVNLYEEISFITWRGFEALHDSKFGQFTGQRNQIYYDQPRFPLARIDSIYHPAGLLRFYGKDAFPDCLPDVLAECPYESRDGPDDDPIMYGAGGHGQHNKRRRATRSQTGTPRPSPRKSQAISSPGSALEELGMSDVENLLS